MAVNGALGLNLKALTVVVPSDDPPIHICSTAAAEPKTRPVAKHPLHKGATPR
jgi:hypothetical protein